MSQNVPAPMLSSAVDIAVGRALSWHEPGWGTFLENVPHAFATREIDCVPGSDELAGVGSMPTWQYMRGVALNVLSGAAFMPGCDALELRYVVEPAQNALDRIRMFVTAKARDWHPQVAEAAVKAACAALPKGFSWKEPEQGLVPPPGEIVVELRRHEEVTDPEWEYIPADFYYTVNDDPGDASGWPTFWHVLAGTSEPLSISLLFMQTDLHWEERSLLGGITTDLSLLSEQHVDYDVLGNPNFFPASANAKVALESWEHRIRQLQRPLLARIAVRGAIEAVAPVATSLSSAIGATMTGSDNGAHPMYVEAPMTPGDERQADFSFDWLEILPWGGHPLWTDEEVRELAPHKLRRLPYLFGLNEAAGLAILPVPDEQGVPGFPRSRRIATMRAQVGESQVDGPSVTLGQLMHLGEAASSLDLPLSAINRHVLVAGSPGSGKTTTVLSLLARLWRDHRIPFLAIEPIKTEYRSLLATPGMEDLYVLCLGRDDLSPLRLNPLEPPPGVRREVHATSVMAALKMALPLFPPLPQLLTEALELAYERAGWDDDTTTDEGLVPPTLRDLLDCFEAVYEQQGYVGEARNIVAAGGVRLRSLLHGSKGRMLDTIESVNFEDLIRRPVVVELDQVGDPDEKAVMAAFLLDRIRAAARARGSTGGQLRHVTALEEAHRLLARVDAHSVGPDGDRSRADAVRAFCEAIGELRAQGEGFILSSLSPSVLAEAAVATTGTRILHRLESAADRNVVLDDLDASQLDREAAARLRQGEAIVRWPQRDEAELVQIVAAPGVDSGLHVEDAEVGSRMASERQAVRSLMPYALCTRDVCQGGCDPKVRAAGHSLAAETGGQARKAWEASGGKAEALDSIAPLLVNNADGDVQLAYCGAVHLSVAGDALKVKRRVDIRPQIAEAIRKTARPT